MSKKLTIKQDNFCREYMIDMNATDCYIRAGYSVGSRKVAGVEGHKLLKNPKIQDRIAELLAERAEKVNLKMDNILKEIMSIANDDIGNYLEFKNQKVMKIDDFGNEYETNDINITVKDSTTINTKNISEISKGKDGQFKIKLYSRESALFKLGEYLNIAEIMKAKDKAPPVIIVNTLPGGDKIGN